MRRIVLIVHDVRSAHNVGSMLRSADGFGVERVYLAGYTPYPATANDSRLPHVAKRATQQIAKTALGAEKTLRWHRESDVLGLVTKLREEGFSVVALEQTSKALAITDFETAGDVALIVGSEIGGIDQDLLNAADIQVVIPMLGEKESFNVAVAASVALYHLRYR